ncbi:MAG: hypothetical protein RLZZ175_2990 [Bacteroidota bacterium]|jgi:outer membrane protein
MENQSNNNVLYITNAILGIAVIVLFVLFFTEKKNESPLLSQDGNDSTKIEIVKPKIANNTLLKEAKVVYVNADSLMKYAEFYKVMKKEAEAKKTKLESKYQAQGQAFQAEVQAFQQKAQTMSQEEGMQAQQALEMKQRQLQEASYQEQAKLEKEMINMNLNLDKKVNKFLKQYALSKGYRFILTYSPNSDVLYANDSLDVTSEVANGLNEMYLSEKASKK